MVRLAGIEFLKQGIPPSYYGLEPVGFARVLLADQRNGRAANPRADGAPIP